MIKDKNSIDTILVDFDGTLMNTTPSVVESWQHTYRTLRGKEGKLEDIYRTLGENLADSMAEAFPDVDTSESLKVYRAFQETNYENKISLFPGMKELLETLKEKGFKVAIVTSRLKRTTYIGLNKFGIAGLFDAVITSEDTEAHKPDPAPVLKALEVLGSRPENTLMMGDSLHDVNCAKGAGVKTVLVGWQVAVSEEDIHAPGGPAYYINEAMDLLDILGEGKQSESGR